MNKEMKDKLLFGFLGMLMAILMLNSGTEGARAVRDYKEVDIMLFNMIQNIYDFIMGNVLLRR